MKDRILLESYPDDLRGAPLLGESRIVIPSMYTESSRFSKVLAIGPTAKVDFKVGDTVFSGRYPKSAEAFYFEGRALLSVRAYEIMAKVDFVQQA